MDADRDFLLWLSGFIDGEGCFLINMKRWPTGNVTYIPVFRLGLRADDAPMLFAIVDAVGVGALYKNKPHGNCPNPGLLWHVGALADTQALVNILDEHPLRTNKRHDYALWREAVQVFARKPTNKARMATLYERLQLVKKFNQTLPEEPEPLGTQLAFWDENMEE